MDLHADNLHDLTTFFFTFGSEFLDGFAYIESNDAAVNHMSEMSGVMGALLSESHRGEFLAMPDDWVLAEIAKELRKDRKLFDSMHLKGQTYLIKEYDILTIGTNPEALPYSYTLEKPGKLETKEFTLDFSMGAEDRGIKEDSYPLTIRTVLPADQYVIGDYLYFVRALFHDWKMPPEFISRWPVFVDRNGKIVYVPTFRHDFVEYHTSVLKLHLDPLIKK